jgi:beta-glucanase (GH16 family)
MKYALIIAFSTFLFFPSCENDGDVSVPPLLIIEDISAFRQYQDSDFEFKIIVSRASDSEMSFDYTTKDGTAVAGTDFVSTSGTVVIPARRLSATVTVKVKGDSLRKALQSFSLVFSNPKNCTLANTEATAKIRNDGAYLPIDNTGYSTTVSYPGYTLAWSDEFNGNSIDENNWSFETGGNGWGTHELQFYTDFNNAFVSSGNLIIEARKEDYVGLYGEFTSARLTTKGKKTFKYGRIDIRAKVPGVEGFMSSLWMLGANAETVGWPACGEIDIMQLPHSENVVYNTLHWTDSTGEAQQYGTNRSLGVVNDNAFHVFTAVWDADKIDMYVDDVLNFHMSTKEGSLPFNNDFFLIFNIAIGGDWPGTPDSSAKFPQRMAIDYVRAFQ